MARLPRLFISGVPQHLVVRGNDRQDIFQVDTDREFFLLSLKEAAAEYSLQVHAYVLMRNHVHLLASGADAESIPRTFQSVGSRYVHYFNRRYRRTGTLWEGRYKAALVQTEKYLFNCHRYIELNPVRAGLVADPGEYRWSSYRRHAYGLEDPIVTPHELVARLDSTAAGASSAYRGLFRTQLDPAFVAHIRDCTQNGWGVGDEHFLEWAGSMCGRRTVRLSRGRRPGERRGL